MKAITIDRDELFDLITGYLLIEPESDDETIAQVRLDGDNVVFVISPQRSLYRKP